MDIQYRRRRRRRRSSGRSRVCRKSDLKIKVQFSSVCDQDKKEKEE
ncbi:hypothetical protein DFA_01930 [Cavenderia fasciculata]|uniref:Uncharacterized protein n=1 Tax=Cavenderia fasciculata TaxID=261658 RepID=F4PQT3_CACFS|nr:uncharacterized protein DFA_01930 [Cavenderia fasciculata]EGG22041.1 hypothetical protein DFA_01930 [Cavenderia fasciculata]|eukprot:XP_004359892.1 hypothetical protein DFA_01930 [Cavenderia fasciculata]